MTSLLILFHINLTASQRIDYDNRYTGLEWISEKRTSKMGATVDFTISFFALWQYIVEWTAGTSS